MSPTILVIEGDAATREMLRFTLETDGYCVVEAANGCAALAALALETPALILQDQAVPDMSGADLTRQLRARAGEKAIPILTLSGPGERRDAARDACEPTPSLAKPIDPAHLRNVIQSYLQQPSTHVERPDRRRVLVVDDDPIQRKLTGLHLELLGFEVTSAASGAEALSLALAEVPDVIFSDVLMPGLDGFQLCFAVRNEPGLRNVPIVLASAWYETEQDRELARQAGATALVRKTPDLADVARALTAAINSPPPGSTGNPGIEVRLKHVQAVNQQLERQLLASSHLARRCTLQAAQMTLLSSAAGALASHTNAEGAWHSILDATLEAAGATKGALYLRSETGRLTPGHVIGFSGAERIQLDDFFGYSDTLDGLVSARRPVVMPTTRLRTPEEANILTRAGAKSAQIVPLTSEGQGVGALVLFANASADTTEDSVAFVRAMAHQLEHSLDLASFFARLTASERRYRAVTEAASDAISLLRPDGVIVEVNPSFIATLGREREQIIGHRIQEFVHHDATEALHAVPFSLDSRSPIRLLRPDGTTALMEFSNRAIELAGESLWVAIGRDVTERVETQTQLMFSDRMATIGSIAAGVAHEINNPLTVTVANLQLALEKLASAAESEEMDAHLPSIGELLREASEGADRVATIVRDLKIFSRAEEEHRGPVDVLRVIQSSLRMARNEIRHRAEVVLDCADVPSVEGNESRLGQVFLNLLVNAAQALPEGHAAENRIVVRTCRMEPGMVAIDVEDTGAGIAPDNLARMFTPFFTTKPRGVGTGLGLSICKRIVTSLGGDISVTSELGHGTRFRVLLKASAAMAPASRACLPKHVVAPRRGKILVVDDDLMTGAAVCRILASEHEVLFLQDASHALARILRGEVYDVIVCDLMMPDMTGPEFYEALAAQAPELSRRVIFMTGGAFTPSARQFLDGVPNPSLAKPFASEALKALVNDHLS
jgi:PAS domain S-box-containing protein